MLESQSSSILEQFQPAISLLEEMVDLGLEVIKESIDRVESQNWILQVLIQKLAQRIYQISGMRSLN
ncbi:MAG: hypothetical protein HC939_23285 [Pleurocapsa sp. SU_5_0]|nr:hypothetical protein [Pleurocapsa sp. SU_5_0]